MRDLFQEFFLLYEFGKEDEAFRTLLPSPEVHFDDYYDPKFHALVNYVLASVFGGAGDTLLTLRHFISLVEEDLEFYPRSFEALKKEKNILLDGLRTEVKSPLLDGWKEFIEHKPQFKELPLSIPWRKFSYDLPLPCWTFTKTPLIFLEPLQGGYSTLFEAIEGKPALFVFETREVLQQCLQFPEGVKTLSDKAHGIYFLDRYSEEVLTADDFEPYFMTPRKILGEKVDLFIEALKRKKDLYELSKRLLWDIQEARLGKSRIAALRYRTEQMNWRDPNKGELVPSLLFQDLILSLRRLKRKVHVIHVVSQVVDGGHAPSRLLENLLVHHDKEAFQISLVVTEFYHLYPAEYPVCWFVSPSSKDRGAMRIKLFKEKGVACFFLSAQPSLHQTAEELVSTLEKLRGDVVVFHGPDVVHSMATALTSIPLRVFFDHGTPPQAVGFDVGIVSSQSTAEVYQELFKSLGMKIYTLPYVVNVKTEWSELPPTKASLGVPEQGKILTTISNHLDHRLSQDMLRAIVDILTRVKEAYYLPMGKEDHTESIKAYFNKQGVGERVRFLGSVSSPSQLARACDLYLNEFPFGSGLGILDAMASGCPVVTMYDEKGPPQARFGGDYMGKDKAITSLKWEDYSNLACKLLTDPKMYEEWSLQAKSYYDQHADIEAYVREFETILNRSSGRSG